MSIAGKRRPCVVRRKLSAAYFGYMVGLLIGLAGSFNELR